MHQKASNKCKKKITYELKVCTGTTFGKESLMREQENLGDILQDLRTQKT
jgi:hypothetical protein